MHGPTAFATLFPSSKPPFPPPPPAPNRHFAHPEARIAFERTLSTPLHSLSLANVHWNAWRLQQCVQPSFGGTYRSATPLQWGIQVLALNLSLSLSTHLLKHTVNSSQTHYKHNHDQPTNFVEIGPLPNAVQSPTHFYTLGTLSAPHIFYV